MKIRRVEDAPTSPLPCFELVADAEAGSITAFRVELSDRTVSFARTDIRKWVLLHEEPHRLLIHVGHDLVVSVTGKDLNILHAALDRDRLLTLRCSKHRTASGPWIKSIELIDRPDSAATS